jgi:hypothetical protein
MAKFPSLFLFFLFCILSIFSQLQVFAITKKIYPYPFDRVWWATLKATKSMPLDFIDEKLGQLQTRWIDVTNEEYFLSETPILNTLDKETEQNALKDLQSQGVLSEDDILVMSPTPHVLWPYQMQILIVLKKGFEKNKKTPATIVGIHKNSRVFQNNSPQLMKNSHWQSVTSDTIMEQTIHYRISRLLKLNL